MLTRQNLTILLAVLLGGCAGLAPVSEADRKLSHAIERELPSLVSAGDYWMASKESFQLAGARSRLNETRAACAALSNSLAYYRKALARDTDAPVHESDTDLGDDEGMMEIRSLFGCLGGRTAEPRREHTSNPQVRKTPSSPVQQG